VCAILVVNIPRKSTNYFAKAAAMTKLAIACVKEIESLTID